MSSEAREQTKFNIRAIRVPRWMSHFNAIEYIAALMAIGCLVLVVLYSNYSLRPELQKAAAAEKMLDEYKKTIGPQGKGVQGGTANVSTIKQTRESLEEFRENWLKPFSQGRIETIDEINSLVKKRKLRLESGLQMSLNSDLNSMQKLKGPVTMERLMQTYRFVRIQLTVQGSYAELRGLLSDIEKSRLFMLIDRMGISGGDSENRADQAGKNGLTMQVGLYAYYQP